MCGICGVLHFNTERTVKTEVLEKMCGSIVHRGPDSKGIYTDTNAGFGVRRLSIIDLQTGDMPIFNEDKTLSVIQNGEIYNFQSLRTTLQERGHNFYTKTDTEIIVHLYEEYGADCVQHLRGMYAFAVWDSRKKKILLARDRIGKKPLYYTVMDNSLVFGSEIKAILEYIKATPGLLKPEINLQAIHYYLTYQYIPGPMTIFKDIWRLPPSSVMIYSQTGSSGISKYWDIDFTAKTTMNYSEAKERLREILTEAVNIRLISDVPLGAFLSGGHDSSIVVGLMSQLSSKPVKTFSIGFENADFSELKYAKIVAEHFNTEHNEFIVKPDFINILPKIIWHYDQPFADTSALPSYYVSNVTRKHVTVALNGDGGDENFGGYLRYRAMKGGMYFGLPFQILGKTITAKLTSLIPHTETDKPKSKFRYIYRLLSALAERPAVRNVLWHAFFENETKLAIYSDDMKETFSKINTYDYLTDIFDSAPAQDILDRAFYTDIKTYLPECLLIKMDIASMANSLEARSPFLDHKLFEFSATLPSGWKIHGPNFHTKHILKDTFRTFLPEKIIKRGKQGFGLPVGMWFKNELKGYIREVLLDKKSLERGYFNKDAIEKLIQQHEEGRADNGYKLWALLVLELWHTEVFCKP
ncbi:MAG: asparagine synthase (glutamine-hydrolyzing) [Elusimicrobiota bacterium]